MVVPIRLSPLDKPEDEQPTKPRASSVWKYLLLAILVLELLGILLWFQISPDDPRAGIGTGPTRSDAREGAPERPPGAGEGPSSKQGPNPASGDEDLEEETERFVNRMGRYAFDYPETWSVTRQGSLSNVSNPAKDVSISIGFASSEDPAGASRDLVASIRNAYERVRVTDAGRSSTRGFEARTTEGSAMNDSGVRLRFLASIVVPAEEDDNYAIGAFWSSATHQQMPPEVRALMTSFDPQASA
ncbi:MAG: hypothetical protein ACRDJ5_04685 [Actinomycetota bacterium]